MADTLIVRGPCKVVFRGDCEANGASVDGLEQIVPLGRSLLVRTSESCEVEARGCEVARTGGEVYERYLETARVLAGEERVIIVGPTDTGKTTLSSFTHSLLAEKHGKAVLVSSDVGQNEMYAPGFVSSAGSSGLLVPGAPGVEPERCFVGAFTPQRALGAYLGCSARLSRGAAVVVDTDGWVTHWDGLLSKAMLAQAVEAHVIVLVGMGEREREYLERRSGARVLRVPALSPGQSKSREERRIHRERLIARALAGAREYKLSPSKTPIYEAPVFRGIPLPWEEAEAIGQTLGIRRIIYAERAQDGLTIVTPARLPAPRGVRLLRPGWEKGLIASAVCGGRDHLALITGIDYRGPRIGLLSTCQPSHVYVGHDRVSLEAYI